MAHCMVRIMLQPGKASTLMGKFESWLEDYRSWAKEQENSIQGLGDQVFNEGYGSSAYGPYIESANGCWVNDISHNSFLDTAMAGGTAIMGHANPIINNAIIGQLEKGALYTSPNAITHAVIAKVLEMLPWFDKAIMCNSGSEATLRAIRIARAHTTKQKIGVFSGGWHGAHDQVLVEEDYTGEESAPKAKYKGKGIASKSLNQLVFLPYNHPAAFDLIRKHADELAVILIEPAQGSNPRDDIGDFMKELRTVTQETDILLCFDEIITGFRLALGGGQEYFGVRADMATYGKTLGGGLAIGMVAGTSDIMSVIRDGPVFMGGTFSANPLSMTSALATLEILEKNSREIYATLNRTGQDLKLAINDFCMENEISAHMIGVGSMLRLVFAKPPISSRRQRDITEVPYSQQLDFYAAMLMQGVHVAANRINFLSVAHSEPDILKLTQAYSDVLLAAREAGFFD
jgi:glutamate-1-semialdehyde 2,1-aminomutase